MRLDARRRGDRFAERRDSAIIPRGGRSNHVVIRRASSRGRLALTMWFCVPLVCQLVETWPNEGALNQTVVWRKSFLGNTQANGGELYKTAGE